MTNKPLGIISTDWHLRKENIDALRLLVIQQCELAKKEGIGTMYHLGDIFHSRTSQRQEELDAFSEMLEIVNNYGLKLIMIPGNHDKTRYDSHKSFLDSFKYHPGVMIIDCASTIECGSVAIHLIPFFSNDLWIEEFESLNIDPDFTNILFSHIAMEGSRNNDGSIIHSSIKPSMFGDFKQVYLGHYHDTHKLGKNVTHLPSIQQNNYGENNKKGFSILMSDGSVKFKKSDFKEFKKIKVDVDTISKKELATIIKENTDAKDNIRMEFTGSEGKLKSVDKVKLNNLGIDVKTKSLEVEDSIDYIETNTIIEHNSQSILESFEEFCEEKELDHTVGIKYINKVLDEQ